MKKILLTIIDIQLVYLKNYNHKYRKITARKKCKSSTYFRKYENKQFLIVHTVVTTQT